MAAAAITWQYLHMGTADGAPESGHRQGYVQGPSYAFITLSHAKTVACFLLRHLYLMKAHLLSSPAAGLAHGWSRESDYCSVAIASRTGGTLPTHGDWHHHPQIPEVQTGQTAVGAVTHTPPWRTCAVSGCVLGRQPCAGAGGAVTLLCLAHMGSGRASEQLPPCCAPGTAASLLLCWSCRDPGGQNILLGCSIFTFILYCSVF